MKFIVLFVFIFNHFNKLGLVELELTLFCGRYLELAETS